MFIFEELVLNEARYNMSVHNKIFQKLKYIAKRLQVQKVINEALNPSSNFKTYQALYFQRKCFLQT